MSSSNFKKFKYSNKYDYPIALSEYLVSNDLQVVFKFYNCLSKNLKNFIFTIEEYNEEGKLIVTSTIEIREFASKNSYFIPKVKFKFNEETKSINYILDVANFENLSYTDNQYLRPTINLEPEESLKKKEKEKKEKMKKKDKKVLAKNDFVASSYSDRFKLKLPKFIVTILVLFTLIFSGLLIYDYVSKSNVVCYESLDSKITFVKRNDGLYVSDFMSNSKYITIRQTYFNEKVLGIEERAFEKADIESLYIDSEEMFTISRNAFSNSTIKELSSRAYIRFESEAFSDCKKLEKIDCENATYVASYAFRDCFKLHTVYLNNAEVREGAFFNDQAIKTFYIGDSTVNEFYQLFVNKSTEYHLSINELGYFSKFISKHYFDCIKYRISIFKYDLNAYIEDYNSLPNRK